MYPERLPRRLLPDPISTGTFILALVAAAVPVVVSAMVMAVSAVVMVVVVSAVVMVVVVSAVVMVVAGAAAVVVALATQVRPVPDTL